MISKDMPFKAHVNDNKCVIIITKSDSIKIEFEKFPKSFLIRYDSIRCIQLWGDTVLLNVVQGDQLMLYAVDSSSSSSAKRIHAAILGQIG